MESPRLSRPSSAVVAHSAKPSRNQRALRAPYSPSLTHLYPRLILRSLIIIARLDPPRDFLPESPRLKLALLIDRSDDHCLLWCARVEEDMTLAAPDGGCPGPLALVILHLLGPMYDDGFVRVMLPSEIAFALVIDLRGINGRTAGERCKERTVAVKPVLLWMALVSVSST